MAVSFKTVNAFPSGGVDSETVLIGQAALKDGLVRVGPLNDETKSFINKLRTWAASQDKKLKTKTVGNEIYWSILNEPPKKRNGATTHNGK